MKREEQTRGHASTRLLKKIECFDGSNPNRCLPWLEQVHMMSNNYNRDYCEELLLNSGGSITKTIHNFDVDATPEQIKDIVLHNHSNLKTPSQRLHAFNSIQQKPDEALQTYNSWYKSHFQLAYPGIDDAGSRTRTQAAFEKAMNFEPISTRRMNEVNQIDITNYDEDFKVNETNI